jgi:hypothetical protein
VKHRAILFSFLSAFVLLFAILFLPRGENRSSTQAYPAPGEPSGSALSGYPAPGSGIFIPAGSAYPPPQADPPLTVTVEPQMRLPIVSMPAQAYSPKKGLAWGGANLYPEDYLHFNVNWVFNWHVRPAKDDVTSPLFYSHQPGDLLPGGVEFVPMIYCGDTADSDGDRVGNYIETARELLGSDEQHVFSTWDGYLLFLNEPWNEYECGEVLTEPQQIVEAYLQIRYTFPDAKLIGPNIKEEALEEGKLDQWRTAVHDYTCSPDSVWPEFDCVYPDVQGYGIHTYHPTPRENRDAVDLLYTKVISWHPEGGPELWVTEFGYCGDQFEPGAAEDIEETVGDFETRSYVDRCAYYANRTDPWRINFTNTCWHDENRNRFLFSELYPELCPLEGIDRINCKDDYNYALFATATATSTTHFDLTLKGVTYKEAGVIR